MDAPGLAALEPYRVRRAILMAAGLGSRLAPVALDRAVQAAYEKELPELDEWSALARELYPDSFLTRVDVAYLMVAAAARDARHADVEIWSASYLHALDAFRASETSEEEMIYGVPLYAGNVSECVVRFERSNACVALRRYDEARDALALVDYARLPSSEIFAAMQAMERLFLASRLDLSELTRRFWDGVAADVARARQFTAAGKLYLGDMVALNGGAAAVSAGGRRPWELFLPLAGKCLLGDAAALLKCETAEDADAVLARADTRELPLNALAHALRLGARFPLAPLSLAEADELAGRLVRNTKDYPALVYAAAKRTDDAQSVLWARALALAAAREYDWKIGGDDALPLARAFAEIERAYLTYCYTPAALEQPELLAPVHRFGLCCVKALDALAAGDWALCVRALHDGLKAAPDMKAMVELLLETAEAEQKARAKESAPPELRQLAEQVKAVLAQYPADDPAVLELKQSPAYQKVAYLIEE